MGTRMKRIGRILADFLGWVVVGWQRGWGGLGEFCGFWWGLRRIFWDGLLWDGNADEADWTD